MEIGNGNQADHEHIAIVIRFEKCFNPNPGFTSYANNKNRHDLCHATPEIIRALRENSEPACAGGTAGRLYRKVSKQICSYVARFFAIQTA